MADGQRRDVRLAPLRHGVERARGLVRAAPLQELAEQPLLRGRIVGGGARGLGAQLRHVDRPRAPGRQLVEPLLQGPETLPARNRDCCRMLCR